MGYKDFVPMNDWKMRQEVGDLTADEWQKSGKLDEEADLVTGSKAKHMVVYMVPIAWTRQSSGHEDRQEMNTEGALTDAGIANLDGMRSDAVATSSGTIRVKIEKTAEVVAQEQKAIDAAKVKEFTNGVREELMAFGSAIMQLKLLEAASDMHAYHAPFGIGCTTLRNKTAKVSKAMEDYMCNPTSGKENGVTSSHEPSERQQARA